jgi:tetratricopeptide (TPR) repeat protein
MRHGSLPQRGRSTRGSRSCRARPHWAEPYAGNVTSVDQPAGRTGLAEQALQAGDLDGAVAHLSAAVRDLTAAGQHRGAALASARLGELFQSGMGNKVAARPWFNRAIRLLEDHEPCVEQGWVAVAAMGCDVEDPAVLLERADFALHRARQFGDVGLEVKALADGGLARVQAGAVAEGMAVIDEAMAVACAGIAEDADTVAKSVCSFYTACYYTADFERVESWTRALRQRGIIGPAPGPQAFLSSHCESVQATLLSHLGRWREAEDVLLRAHEAMEQAMPGMAWHTPIALAELRIRQGRLSEAEALLLGFDDHIQALVPMARLHLARGDHELAAAAARRGLRMIVDDRVRAAALLGVLVEAELAQGDLTAASAASAELDRRVGGLDLPALGADAARLRALVRNADGDVEAAREALEAGLTTLEGTDLLLLKMSLRMDLARLLERAEPAAAKVEAGTVGTLLARLDVVLSPDDLALLERLDVKARPTQPAIGCRVATLVRDGGWWTAGCDDVHVRLRDTKGLRYLADLVGHPGVDRHVLDLVDVVEGVADASSGVDRRRLGDAGPLLDRTARAAYRRRVAALRDEVEDALAVEDDDRAARAQVELDTLISELARSLGLGGRDRRASSAAERARLNVTRAVRSALVKLMEALPEAGGALDRRVRTGSYCAYEPHPDDAVIWSVQSRLNGDRED